ncbi:MAG: ABC transporter ATP-binding protein [Halobacteriales archaeon]
MEDRDAVLEIEDLVTYYHTEQGDVHAVEGVTLTLKENETLGLVGESGSGKSTLAYSINRVLPDNGEVIDGEVRIDDVDLTELSEKELREYRWTEISMIPQSAMNALDPVYTIQDQIVEVLQAHRPISEKEAQERARELFDLVDLDEDRLTDYPHQFSGGMKQRAMIALAMALDPKIILADEPTTALDVIIQERILRRIQELQEDIESSMILITHDISVVSETCDRIAVMYGGNLVESSDTRTIINDAHHPYTLGLKNAFPTIDTDEQELISIPGEAPDLTEPEDKCMFAPRCPFAIERCRKESPERREIEDGHFVECHRADEVEMLQAEAAKPETWRGDHTPPKPDEYGDTTDEYGDTIGEQ